MFNYDKTKAYSYHSITHEEWISQTAEILNILNTVLMYRGEIHYKTNEISFKITNRKKGRKRFVCFFIKGNIT